MQDEIVNRLPPLERSLIALTCSSFKTRFHRHRMTTEKMLERAALDGNLLLFKKIQAEFDFPFSAFPNLPTFVLGISRRCKSLDILAWIVPHTLLSRSHISYIFHQLCWMNSAGMIQSVFLSPIADQQEQRLRAIEAVFACIATKNTHLAVTFLSRYTFQKDELWNHNGQSIIEIALSTGSPRVIQWVINRLRYDLGIFGNIGAIEFCAVPSTDDLVWFRERGIDFCCSANLQLALKFKTSILLKQLLSDFDRFNHVPCWEFFRSFTDSSYEPIYALFLEHPKVVPRLKKERWVHANGASVNLTLAAFEFLSKTDLLTPEFFEGLNASCDLELLCAIYWKKGPSPTGAKAVMGAAVRCDSAATVLKVLNLKWNNDEPDPIQDPVLSLDSLMHKGAITTATAVLNTGRTKWDSFEAIGAILGICSQETLDRWMRWCHYYAFMTPLHKEKIEKLKSLNLSRGALGDIQKEWGNLRDSLAAIGANFPDAKIEEEFWNKTLKQ